MATLHLYLRSHKYFELQSRHECNGISFKYSCMLSMQSAVLEVRKLEKGIKKRINFDLKSQQDDEQVWTMSLNQSKFLMRLIIK